MTSPIHVGLFIWPSLGLRGWRDRVQKFSDCLLVAIASHLLNIIVVCTVHRKQCFWLIGLLKQRLSMPERNRAIVGAVNKEHRTVNGADFFDVGEFIKREEKRSHKSPPRKFTQQEASKPSAIHCCTVPVSCPRMSFPITRP